MNLQLFHKWQCPYSARVRDFVDEHRLGDRIEYVEIQEAEGARDRLVGMTGKTQVPCLVVDGEPMLESGAIVEWLQQNLVKS
ncbi:MAG TPA: glutathione S-transferase N-terminal domain-containing protein [Microvirga sp.]|jgi:glutathione S-transferase|nr:glutathione S-transferase N-terminal domain-containing protein [Microvirga sp.]